MNAATDATDMIRAPFALAILLLFSGCQDADRTPPTDDVPTEPSATATEATGATPDVPNEADAVEAAQEDTYTVVFFGDSLTAGYGLADPEAEAYPALIGDRLRQRGIDARVINAGSSGETTAGGLRRVDWVLGRTTPDVFVLALGGNDMLRGQPPAATKQNLEATLAKVRESAPDAILVVAGMEALANYGQEYRDDYREVFREVAEDFDAAFIPFLLEGVGGVPELNQADGVHPTAEGQRIMAATVWDALAPLVREG